MPHLQPQTFIIYYNITVDISCQKWPVIKLIKTNCFPTLLSVLLLNTHIFATKTE